MQKPLVSIVIPVYNGSDYVGEAIDSALGQTYPNVEVIVINDGSKDDGKTDEIVQRYGDRVRYFVKENGGVSTALNLGISQMQGEWFSWLSHDDVYAPNKIERQMEIIERLRTQGEDVLDILVYSACEYIDANGKKLDKQARVMPDGLYEGNGVLYNMFSNIVPGGCGLLIPKSAFEKVGLFNVESRYMQDVEMWYKMFLSGFQMYTDSLPVLYTRIHGNQGSSNPELRKHLKKEVDLVGAYMAENLQGKTYRGKSLIEKYLICCIYRNSEKTADSIYCDLCEKGQMHVALRIRVMMARVYAKIRKRALKLYYQVKLKVKR